MRGFVGLATLFLGMNLAPITLLAPKASAQEGSAPESSSVGSTETATDGGNPPAGSDSAAEDPPETEEPSEEARAMAREAYSRGEELFRDGQYVEAEAAFREAFEAVSNPVVLLSIAESQERDGRGAEASRTLRRYLDLREDAPDQAEIEGRIEALEARPARLILRSFPEGAAIQIDGEEQIEITPATLEVPPGEHSVTFLQEGYLDATETVTTEFATDATVEVTLDEAPPPGDDPFGELGEGDEYEEGLGAEGADSEAGVSPAVWVAASVAGAGLVAGTVLGFLALSEQADFDDMPTEAAADRGERLALFADVSFGLAAAAGLTAIVLYLTGQDGESQEAFEADDSGDDYDDEVAIGRRERQRARVHYAPAVTPDGAGMGARVEF